MAKRKSGRMVPTRSRYDYLLVTYDVVVSIRWQRAPMTRSKIKQSVWPTDIPGHLEASIETQLHRPDDANKDGFTWHTITRAVRIVLGQKPSVIVSLSDGTETTLDADRKVNIATLHDNPDSPVIAGNWLG
jgi:hypothetical protein